MVTGLNKQNMYNSAFIKLQKELDIVKILRRIRKFNSMKQIIFKRHQRYLAMHFTKNVINDEKFKQEIEDSNKKDW